MPETHDSIDLREFISGFLVETEEILAGARANLLALDSSLRRAEPSLRAIRALFRAMHTIKGLSAMVALDPLVQLAHGLEELLRAAEQAPAILTEAALDRIQRGLGALDTRLAEVGRGENVSPPPRDLLDELESARSIGGAAPVASEVELALEPEIADKLTGAERMELERALLAGLSSVRVDFAPSPERASQGLSITTIRERLSRLGEIVRVVPISCSAESCPGGISFALLLVTGASDEEIAEAAATRPERVLHLGPSHPGAAAEQRPTIEPEIPEPVTRAGVVRVEVERLDEAMDRLSALIVTRYRIERAVSRLTGESSAVRELREIAQDNARQLRDLRTAILQVRMVAVSEVLERVPLLVRGLCRSTGKSVDLRLDVGRAELDKSVAERIFPALVHLIRNAVDHGIEPPEERRRLGKSEQGRVRVACVERSNNQLEISIEDDGGGIDVERLAERVGREVPRSESALLDLITTPGLSTRAEATTTSGRGIGMDIVKRVVAEELGGELSVNTEPGAGTTFTMLVPVNISIVDAFTFECAGERFAVPVALVDEIVEVLPGRAVSAPGRDGERPVSLFARRGEAVPLVALSEIFSLPGRSGGHKAFIVSRAGHSVALAVDSLLGQQEVVVRPLEDPLVRRIGLSGTTDLGDGRPTLVLDLSALSGALETPAKEAM